MIISNFPQGGGVGGGYNLLTNIKNFAVDSVDDGAVNLVWQDPDDVVVDAVTITEWAGTMIRRKTGSYPANEKDGALVVDSKVKDQYKTTPFEDDGLTNGVTYYYMAFPYTDKKVITVDAGNRITGVPTAFPAPGPLSGFSWGDIKLVSEAGLASTYWSVGDEKDIVINGETITMQIYGFNHDNLTGGGKAGVTFGMKDLMASTRQMNGSNTNANGWGGCAMRTWVTGTLIGQLPVELQAVLKPVDKLTSAGSQSATINTTSDKVFLFSEVELFGGVTYSKAGEGSQYPVYSDNASRIKKLSNGSGAADVWWERSPHGGTSTVFCGVHSDGTAISSSASYSSGVCWGFCV